MRKIKNIIKAAIIVSFTFLVYPIACIFLKYKKIWLVSENEFEGRDNGYVFFKYMREHHKEINCYYPINYKSKDFPKIMKLGNTIKFGSIKHYFYFCAAKYNISSKSEGFYPHYFLHLLGKKRHLFGKYIFLQHGVIKDDLIHFYKRNCEIDLFICGAKPEFDDVSKRYGYKSNEVAYTGLARFDEYHNLTMKNEILIMPTWRRGLNDKNLIKSDYFINWNRVVNSEEINDLLKKYGYNAYFYVHPQFQKFSHTFKTEHSNIKIASFDEYDVRDLIKQSKLLITDFSSVFFDFGYMEKPVIYFQFDENTFFGQHYVKGYFDYRKNGFGPVCNNYEDVVLNLEKFLSHSCMIDSKSLENHKLFFPLFDSKNCDRIFESIIKIKG